MGAFISLHLYGVSKFEDATAEMILRLNAASRKIVETGTLKVASSARREFRGRPGGQRTSKKTGRIYYSFAPPFQAIPPKPTSRSGNLQNSVGTLTRLTPLGASGWMGITGTAVSYAPYVEYGTRFMAKEPFMEKALDDNRIEIQDLAEVEWAKAMEE